MNKYTVYRNDIKFRDHRNIDPDRAIWTNDVKQDFINKNTDSISYRMEDCKRENYETLDISHMTSECFDELIINAIFKLIKNKIQHIFAKDCRINSLPNLYDLSSLLTLDISNNNLEYLPELPLSLEELIVTDNKLKSITNHLPNLLRLIASNNMITFINYSSSKLQILYINNNPLTNDINNENFKNLKNLYYLDASNTKITNIHSLSKLNYLNISHTYINTLPILPILDTLECNESNLKDIKKLTSLKTLEMSNSKIEEIHYIENLSSLIYHNTNPIKISKKYNIYQVKKNKNNINKIIFKLK